MTTVLVIDDMPQNLLLLRRVLTPPAFSVTEASGSAAALAAASLAMPDLVLLDLRLGEEEVTGYELARQLRALPGGERAVIVALSAGAVMDDEATSLAAGFDGYISKPINVSTFPETVLAYAARRPRASTQ